MAEQGFLFAEMQLQPGDVIDYKDKPVVGFDEVMEQGRMTIEEIKQKTSLCFLLNPNIPEEEKICVIEKVMATKATIVPKAALCNIITYILKQNAKLQEKLNIRSCQNCKHNNKSCPINLLT